MRVQSFGEMPKEMVNTFESITSGGKNQKPSISPINGPPVSTYLENKDSQESAESRGRPRQRSSNGNGPPVNPGGGLGQDNGDYTPSWSSPNNPAPSTMSSALPPKFAVPTVSTKLEPGRSKGSPSIALSPSKQEDPLDVVKRRQASRRAARRALSASDTDARRPRAESGEKEDLLHGPGTPVAVGKYNPDGSRKNIETVDMIARSHMHPLPNNNPVRKSQELFDEDAPLKCGGGNSYNLDMLGDDFMGPPALSKNDSYESSTGTRSGSESSPKISLATRRRQERAKKEQQRRNMRKKHTGLEVVAQAPAPVAAPASPVRKVKGPGKRVKKKRVTDR